MSTLWAWVQRLLSRLLGRTPPTAPQSLQCLHPNPPGFMPCNRYGYATCLTCKAKVPC